MAKPCLLTNFQSISFFPELLETKGFLPASPQKFSHLNTLKVVDRDFMLAIRTYQKAAAAQLVNCKGGRAKLHQHTKAKNLTVKLQWLHENSFPHSPHIPT